MIYEIILEQNKTLFKINEVRYYTKTEERIRNTINI